jgi:hypothetical protein
MKKAIFLMGYLSLGCGLTVDAMSATRTGSIGVIANGADQPFDTLLTSSGFIPAILKDTLATKILASSIFYIIQKNLNLIHSTYIDSARQCLDKIIAQKEAKNEKYSQLKKLSALLNSLLRYRNDILRILKLKKNDTEHGFADLDNPLMAGILCMFAYIEWDQLNTIAKFLTALATDPKAGNYRTTYETVAKKINDLLNTITEIEELIKSLSPTKDDLLENAYTVSIEDKDALLKDLSSLMEQAQHMRQLLEKQTS